MKTICIGCSNPSPRVFSLPPDFRERVAGMLQGSWRSGNSLRDRRTRQGRRALRFSANRAYVFDAVDVAQLFKAPVAADSRQFCSHVRYGDAL